MQNPAAPAVPEAARDLHRRLSPLMFRDQRRLQRRLDGVRKLRDPQRREAALAEIAAEVGRAEARLAARRAAVPAITYPAQLPVSERRDDIAAAIRDHQVVIVAGETGSGKTTQLPKICLELGRGVNGLIGHTQPRRLAARTVADRIAEELGTELGDVVGYKVRFTDQVSERSLVKLMTDGILLAELQTDRMLRQYDTLIIDEAHERSLNIDFILGYLRQLLPRRPDLKVVITSATIETDRFAKHFADAEGNPAPIVEVSGRTYPVEVRYRPLVEVTEADEEDEADEENVRDQIQAIGDAVEELAAEGPGDILVFLSGEREIRDTADALGKLVQKKRALLGTEILPLYARLSSAEQHRVFAPHGGRRVVLATNVAETSLTVPGIKHVVDPGTARISRYSSRLKVQRLPIEPVSQASANQRKGRCGRTSDGICIRLYDEQDFESRPEFTDPEILRTNLASVILQMTSIGLGDIGAFPFIDPPDRRNITDGVNLLHELGALDPAETDPAKRLTALGRRLAQLPVDPRLARMVLEGERNGCATEVIVIAAALSIQDPRERPADKQVQADQAHARFADKESDFVAYLNLWRYLREQQRALSSSAFRRMCKAEYLNYLRVREWQDIVSQLRQVLRTREKGDGRRGAGADLPEEIDTPKVHQSLLPGLLSHIGLKDAQKHEYLGARGAKFAVFPGSALFKKPPRWVMAAELVETSRLWGRVAGRVEPEWVEPLAQHLVKRSYSEPHWEKKQAAVMAYEKVTLYGIPIVTSRKVNFGRIDPGLSRELFIRHALVEGDWQTHHQFWRDNQRLLTEVEELENRARRRDILVDDETIFQFYDQRIPADVVSGRHFDTWWKKTRRERPDLLTFTRDLLVNSGRGGVDEEDYPDEWRADGVALPLTYTFDPGTPTDGVTVDIPLPLLNQVPAESFDWQVPGLREELVIALIRSLPKAIRRNFVPVPDFARAALAAITPGGEPLLDALTRQLRRMTGVTVPAQAWDLAKLPPHLRVTFRVLGEDDKPVAEGKDLPALQRQLRQEVRQVVAAAAPDVARTGLKEWSIDALPRTIEQVRAGYAVTAYPALVDEGATVGVKVFDSPAEQEAAHWAGTRRLLRLTVPSPAKFLQGRLSNEAKLALSRNPHGGVQALIEDASGAAIDKLIADAGGPAWDAEGFAVLRDKVRADLVDTVVEVMNRVRQVLAAAYAIEQRLGATRNLAVVAALADIRNQLTGLVHAGFITEAGYARLPDLLRYLTAIERRLDRLPGNPQRDKQQQDRIAVVQREYQDMVAALPPAKRQSTAVRQIRWMIEELRVNVFAQALGTPYPVSEQRIYRAMDDAEGR
ncbi:MULTISPECIES: ATP-dependent RNA helicase HrpA [Micromonospora]|uniref:ATP-dependent RNA helicase HrpA n=1 Tax=Micromonospora solifontis TaxID=2487138 RepID=A0ABX9WJB3_9ACTN|nr:MULTISPECIES: ATP-dependent RNA helicase HrpA [Micromonospora]NES15415.1 ATP-dependent RNA helicase HrpA [Micromonospora sp. PPF5-17B]NES35839.1 ATP-dependent RNA helicase HrpA [Micromonospora solifontis]NES58009.1 ATP-dependent RNA helicase HrpA [Micromonospora sp. PPF5-6]RNM00315.1 ATP-dependent RNA helicase HrpA [Micromonospora solifontis]